MIAALLVAAATALPEGDPAPGRRSPGELVRDRPYALHGPKTGRPLPLLVVLHCFGCPAELLPAQLGLTRRDDLLVAVPRGHLDSRGWPFWNASSACCDFDRRRPDDVAYVRAVVEDVKAKRAVDPRRIFALGFSNGAYLAHRLACEQADVFAGIVSIAGAGTDGPCRPALPVAVLQVHGDADEVVPLRGGKLGGGLPRGGDAPAVFETLAAWARRDGCGDLGEAHDLQLSPGVRARATEWRSCAAGGVAFWRVPGGGHNLPLRREFGELALKWLLDRARR